MGEKTKITKVSKNYLRTAIPKCIVNQFKLKEGQILDWEIRAKEDQLTIIVTPIKKRKPH